MLGAVVDRLEQEQGRRHPKRAGWIVTGHLNLMMPGGQSRRLLEVRVALGESLGQCVESRERVLRKRLGPFCMQEPRRVPDLGVRDVDERGADAPVRPDGRGTQLIRRERPASLYQPKVHHGVVLEELEDQIHSGRS